MLPESQADSSARARAPLSAEVANALAANLAALLAMTPERL